MHDIYSGLARLRCAALPHVSPAPRHMELCTCVFVNIHVIKDQMEVQGSGFRVQGLGSFRPWLHRLGALLAGRGRW